MPRVNMCDDELFDAAHARQAWFARECGPPIEREGLRVVSGPRGDGPPATELCRHAGAAAPQVPGAAVVEPTGAVPRFAPRDAACSAEGSESDARCVAEKFKT